MTLEDLACIIDFLDGVHLVRIFITGLYIIKTCLYFFPSHQKHVFYSWGWNGPQVDILNTVAFLHRHVPNPVF